MLFNLPDGRTIEVPTSLMLSLDDEEFNLEIEQLMSLGISKDINDPWTSSYLINGEIKIVKDESEDIDETDDWVDLNTLDD